MGKILFKKGDLVYIPETNSIGFILHKEEYPEGNHRSSTDVDGWQDDLDLVKITKPGGVLNLIMQHGDVFIATSTKSMINKHFKKEIFNEKLLTNV